MLVLSLVVNPWLLLVGVAADRRRRHSTPADRSRYGYLGLGEVMVLVFFGFVATVGSAYVQLEARARRRRGGARSSVGLPACAILLANNVRDVATDTASRASARSRCASARRPPARCSSRATSGSFAAVVAIGITQPWALLGLLALPLAVAPVRTMRSHAPIRRRWSRRWWRRRSSRSSWPSW